MIPMKKLLERYQELIKPSVSLIDDIKKIDGDIIILGVAGKMGPDMALLAVAAIKEAGIKKRVIGVARFSDKKVKDDLEAHGVETFQGDLLDDMLYEKLPKVKNVIYLAGTKFGTQGNESFTWAMNAYLPSKVAQHFRSSNIVAFSTGNVYPLSPVKDKGLTEKDATGPIGEYAQSCLGRERIFEYFSNKNQNPLLICRLNYACDVKYGVLFEIARAVFEEKPIDLTMGFVNVIWQGDANEYAIRSLLHCNVPPKWLNITGAETLSVRKLAEGFGEIFSKTPGFKGAESETALLSNSTECFRLMGEPKTPLKMMMEVIAEWIRQGGETLNKPTHFQEREGKF